MTVTVERLAAELKELGVNTGDLLMVHASMRALGPVQDGAAGVVAALDRAVGPSGTVTMNLGAPAGPKSDKTVFDKTVFDKDSTPADPDVGVLAEVFRTLPATQVSDHPDARFGARGALAAELLADPPWDDYYGPGSILDRFTRASGKVLRLGAEPDTVTLIHFAEYLADVPDKTRVSRVHRLLDPSGGFVLRKVSCLDDTDGIAPWNAGAPGEDYFAEILRAYLATGRARQGTIGTARSELLDSADLVEFATSWLTANLGRPHE